MKKLIITLLILLGIGAVAVVTCPDRQAIMSPKVCLDR